MLSYQEQQNLPSANRVDHQYYDILISSPISGVTTTPISYSTYLSQPIVNKADDYYLAIDRFKLPMGSVPIYIFNNTPNFYQFQMSYNGITSTQSVQWIPCMPTQEQRPSTSASFYYEYAYPKTIYMFNQAILACYNGLVALAGASFPVYPGTTSKVACPYFQVDWTGPHLSLVAPIVGYDTSAVSGVSPTPAIWLGMNVNLLKFLSLMDHGPSTASSPFRVFSIYNRYNNTVPGLTYTLTAGGTYQSYNYVMTCEDSLSQFCNWRDGVGIVITSDVLPINPEMLPNLINNSTVNTRNIVANFDFVWESANLCPTTTQYILQSPYKKIDLINQDPLKLIGFNGYWYDGDNNFHQLYIYPGDSFSMRLVFIRKSKVSD